MAIIDFDDECWDDPWVQKLPPLGKLLFNYLFTNKHRNISGIYTITVETISFDTGLSKKQVLDFLKILHPKVHYDPERSICWVVKHTRRQLIRSGKISPKQREGVRRQAQKFHWHPFFLAFMHTYPEIFTKQEIEEFVRDTHSKSMDTHSKGMDTFGGEGEGEGKGSSLTPLPLDTQKKEYRPNFSEDSDALKLSRFLFGFIKTRDPKAKEPDFQKWAVYMDRLLRIDQRTPDEVTAVIKWCQGDDFWQNNILSTEKLREQFAQLNLKMAKDRREDHEDPFDKKLVAIKQAREKNDGHIQSPTKLH